MSPVVTPTSPQLVLLVDVTAAASAVAAVDHVPVYLDHSRFVKTAPLDGALSETANRFPDPREASA
jgi:hypothetical protein